MCVIQSDLTDGLTDGRTDDERQKITCSHSWVRCFHACFFGRLLLTCLCSFFQRGLHPPATRTACCLSTACRRRCAAPPPPLSLELEHSWCFGLLRRFIRFQWIALVIDITGLLHCSFCIIVSYVLWECYSDFKCGFYSSFRLQKSKKNWTNLPSNCLNFMGKDVNVEFGRSNFQIR